MSTCNCKFGTLMELACVGKADQHFIGAPSHSLFRQQYHQHGNFSVDWCVKDPFRGNGRTWKATISKEGDLLIGGMMVLTSTDANSTIPTPEGTCRLLIGNQCIQTVEIENITSTHRAYNHRSLPAKSKIRTIYGAEFFFVKEKTPMWLNTNQTIQVELRLDDGMSASDIKSFEDVTGHFQSFQVYLPENERIPPSMQHLPIRVKQSMEYNLAEIQPDNPLRLKLPFNLPIYKLTHGLPSTVNGTTVVNDINTEIVRVYVNNNLRFEGTQNEIEAIASLFYEADDAILFGIPSEDGFGGAFNMSRADTVEVEFEFDTVNASTDDKEEREKLAGKPISEENKAKVIEAYSYNILQYQNGKYSLLYSD